MIQRDYRPDFTELKRDRQTYKNWFQELTSSGTNEQELEHLKKVVILAIEELLTETQRAQFLAYYVDGMAMADIAGRYGIDKSSVSRTIKRARVRLQRVLKYASRSTMHVDWDAEKIKRECHKRVGA